MFYDLLQWYMEWRRSSGRFAAIVRACMVSSKFPSPPSPGGSTLPMTVRVWLLIPLLAVGLVVMVSHSDQLIGAGYAYDTDFRSFYAAGQMLNAGIVDRLYDIREQYRFQDSVARLNDPERLLAFLNLPFAALPFALLARFPYLVAYKVWAGLNILLVSALGCFSLRVAHQVRLPLQVALLIMVFTFNPIYVAVVLGQWSLWMLLGLLFSWSEWHNGRELHAGFWLGCLILKPQLLLVPVVALIWLRKWRVLKGLLLAVGAAGLISVAMVGLRGMQSYVSLLIESASWGERYGLHPQNYFNIRMLSQRLLDTTDLSPVSHMWILLSSIIMILLVLGLGERRTTCRQLSATQWLVVSIGALLVSPHTYRHDLSLLALPGVLLVAETVKGPPDIMQHRWRRLLLVFLILSFGFFLPRSVEAVLVVGVLCCVFLTVVGASVRSRLFREARS